MYLIPKKCPVTLLPLKVKLTLFRAAAKEKSKNEHVIFNHCHVSVTLQTNQNYRRGVCVASSHDEIDIVDDRFVYVSFFHNYSHYWAIFYTDKR